MPNCIKYASLIWAIELMPIYREEYQQNPLESIVYECDNKNEICDMLKEVLDAHGDLDFDRWMVIVKFNDPQLGRISKRIDLQTVSMIIDQLES